MSQPPLLELAGVERRFRVSGGLLRPRREVRAVNGVSLAIERGEVLGLVGESGCGKSTLARLMLGLLVPSAGEVRLAGVTLASLQRKGRARRVQPIFQDPYGSLNPRRRVASIIASPLVVHAIGDATERRRRVEEMMALVALPPRLARAFPGQLSGGQRQRVAIARALVMRPELVICDEPTSALDVSVQAQILNLLQELRRKLGLTLVLISHNLAVVEHLATRVAVMYLGRIVETAETRSLFAAPRHPYTQALLASVLAPTPGRPVPEVAMTGGYPNPLDPPPGCPFHPRCPEAMAVCRTTLPLPSPRIGGGRVECHLHAG
jgi:peptide/nickel transport system ATP-binding protein